MTCSPASAGSHSPRKRRATQPSVSLKSTPLPARSSNTTGPMCETTVTSATCGMSAPISSPEVSRASHSVLPGSAEARQMTVTSGLKCCELLGKQNQLGCLVRTCLESSRWNSTVCLLTWKKKVTPAGRLLFQLAPSMRNTAGTESGLSRSEWWPTPRGSKVAASVTMEAALNRIYKTGYRGNLEEAVAMRLWPTPSTANPGSRPNGKRGRALEKEVSMAAGLRTRGMKLRDRAKDLRLNPNWVEWLMGYPKEWTKIPASFQSSQKPCQSRASAINESKDCAGLEMPSSRKPRNKFSK